MVNNGFSVFSIIIICVQACGERFRNVRLAIMVVRIFILFVNSATSSINLVLEYANLLLCSVWAKLVVWSSKTCQLWSPKHDNEARETYVLNSAKLYVLKDETYVLKTACRKLTAAYLAYLAIYKKLYASLLQQQRRYEGTV